MLFNSIDYAWFLPIVFLLYWFVFNKSYRLQNLFIVVVSYIFYGWWDVRFLGLMFLTSFASWGSGLGIAHYQQSNKPNLAKTILIANMILNFGILGFFKYFNFFAQNFEKAFSIFGVSTHITSLNIILPVGISFYTFQAIGYSIDVYRKTVPPSKSLIEFLAFISFFPQLVAGPIERASHLLPQFQTERHFDYDVAVMGLRQILWGLFKKIVIANSCAEYVTFAFGNYEQYSGITLFISAVLFSFQIYCDFSGYSDIAIGSGKLLGIELCQNFAYPYFSRDIAEFWRRWHISLTTWFRDYLYIPLGGSRCSNFHKFRNTVIVFLASGFWHGANWTFILWGGIHALLFLPLILTDSNRKYTKEVVASESFLPSLKEFWQIALTFTIVALVWVVFRAENITQLCSYMYYMIVNLPFNYQIGWKSQILICGLPILFMLLMEWLLRHKQFGLDVSGIKSNFIKIALYYSIILVIFYYSGITANTQFIYFQF